MTLRRAVLSGALVPLAILAAGGLLPGGKAALHAQSWEARLEITAFPSPYLSDWESNPTIGRLTITNPTSADQNVVLAYRVSAQGGRVLASGRSNPILVPRGAPTVISDFVNLSGSSQHDRQLESEMRRTGRLPEGDNTTCVSVTDVSGFVLDEDCVTFSILYPDPPYLIGPLDEAALTSGHPIFQWTPLQVPPAFQLSYVVRVSEVLQGQVPLQALVANIPVFEATTRSTTLEYPLGALPLVPGKAYAWRVQALDHNGYAASTGEGRSEVWTFAYRPHDVATEEAPAAPTGLRLTFFDPEGPLPELWRTMNAGSLADLRRFMVTQARTGTLELPIPLPSVLGGLADARPGTDLRSGGAQGAAFGSAARRQCQTSDDRAEAPPPEPMLPGMRQIVSTSGRAGGGAAEGDEMLTFGLEGEISVDLLNPLLSCLGVDDISLPPLGDAAVQFAIWRSPSGGLPHVTLAIKLRAFPHEGSGLLFKHAVFVINLMGDFTISPRELPASMREFFGPYEFEVWGTGLIDLATGLAGARRDRSKLWQAMPGINFFGVIDLARLRDAVHMAGFGLGMDSLVLQGFVGFREKTFRQIEVGPNSGRADRRLRDRWYVRGSVPLAGLGLIPGVTSRHLEIEIGRRDSAASEAQRLTSAMVSRYRVAIRIVLRGFDNLKPYLGVERDSVLAFFVELQHETTGAPVTTTTRPRSNAVTRRHQPNVRRGPADSSTSTSTPAEVTRTFGTDATFRIGPRDSDNGVFLHDVELTWVKSSGHIRASAAWGFGAGEVRMERIGTLEIEPYLIPPRVPAQNHDEPPRGEQLQEAIRSLATRRDALVAATQALQEAIQALQEAPRILVDEIDREDREDLLAERDSRQRVVTGLSREVETLQNQVNTLQNQEDRSTPGRRRLRARVMIGLDQGATAAEVIGLGIRFAPVVADWLRRTYAFLEANDSNMPAVNPFPVH